MEVVYSKHYFNIIKICFEAIQNGSKSKSVPHFNKSLSLNLMCDAYREACLVKKMFTNGLNMGFPHNKPELKRVHEVKTHGLPRKEKFQAQ